MAGVRGKPQESPGPGQLISAGQQRSAGKGPLAAAAELGVGVVACGPLGHGLLTSNSRVRASDGEQIALGAIEAQAAELDLGIARLVLAWRSSFPVTVPAAVVSRTGPARPPC
jgi:aryl-alcohol dehydrogenase-like predicted oxidoreductase